MTTDSDIAPGLEDEIRQARQDLGSRMKLSQEAMHVVAAEFVTWPSSALGCPEEGMMYTQALVPGYRIRLAAGDDVHHYHGARDKPPFHCPKNRVQQPAETGKGKPAAR